MLSAILAPGVDPSTSSALHGAAIESCPEGFLAVDASGRLVEANEAYARRSGYSRGELVGMALSQLATGSTDEQIVAGLAALTASSGVVVETWHRAKDGALWPVEVTAFHHPGDGGLFFAFHRDLTRRRREAALLEARLELAHLALEGSLDRVMQRTIDAAERLTGSAIGFFHFVDDGQQDLTLTAWSSNTLANMCTAEGKGFHYPIALAGVWADCFHARAPVLHNDYASLPHKKGMPEGHAAVTRLMTLPVLRGDAVIALLGVGNKKTDYGPDDVAVVQALAVSTMDLVARLRAEEQLRASEERFRTLYESMAQGVVYQSADGQLESANPAAERLLGLTSAQLHDRTSVDPRWQAIHEDGTPWPGEDHPSMTALRTGETVRAVIGVYNPQRGARVWLQVTATPRFRPGQAKPWQVCAAFEDLSDRKAAEEARLELERRDQRMKKLESLGVLAGGVAHDFNNLLAAIIGHLDLAAGDLDPGSFVHVDLAGARQAADRATHICRQMLAYSGRGRFVVAPATWNDLLADREATSVGVVGGPVEVVLTLSPVLHRIEADAGQLRRLVHNLVENAAEALGPVGGVVEVATGVADCTRADLDACLLGDGLAPGRYATLEVRDGGEGMDAATQARVFDPFFSTRFTGRGLGMAEVVGIVRAHGGAVGVQSASGRGTTVRVLLPCLEEAAGLPTAAPAPAAEPYRGARCVLVVDDDDAIRLLCQRLLEREGFATLAAASGAEALDVLRRAGGRVALVILDVSMPGMSGDQVLAEVRRSFPGLRVIMSSGFTAEVLAGQLAVWGAEGFLQKPYDGRALVEKVEAVLGSRAAS